MSDSIRRLTVIVCLGAGCILAANAAGDVDFSFPLTEPEVAGMNLAKPDEARKYALTGGGFGCILRGGRLVLKWGDQRRKYDIYSSTKSIRWSGNPSQSGYADDITVQVVPEPDVFSLALAGAATAAAFRRKGCTRGRRSAIGAMQAARARRLVDRRE